MALTDSEVTASPVLARPHPIISLRHLYRRRLDDLSEPLRDVLVMLSRASLSACLPVLLFPRSLKDC